MCALFGHSWANLAESPTVLQSQIPWGFSVTLPDSQVWKSVVAPRTFLTVRVFLWYNCSVIWGSSARQPSGGASDDLLQEGLCHTLGHPGLLQPEPLSLRRPLLTRPSTGDTQTLKGRSGSASLGSVHFNILFIIPFSNKGVIGYVHLWSS